MKKYLAMFRIQFINTLQYRTAALAGIMTQIAWGFMEIFAFAAFFRANPDAFPMEFSQTVSYIWMQQAFLALFMQIVSSYSCILLCHSKQRRYMDLG